MMNRIGLIKHVSQNNELEDALERWFESLLKRPLIRLQSDVQNNSFFDQEEWL